MKNKLKIAFYSTAIIESGGGLEKYFIETAKNISSFSRYQVDIITMDNNFTEKLLNYLGVYYFSKVDKSLLYKEDIASIKKRLGKANYYKCRNFLELKERLSKYDVIYSKNELLEAFVLKIIVRYKNIPPIVFGCHTPVFYPISDSFHSKIHNYLYKSFIYKWLASGIKAFHVTNNNDKSLLTKIFPNKKVFMVYNPFDSFQFNKNLIKHTYNFKFDKHKFNILWLARITEQKGINSLVNIIDEINKTSIENKIVFNIIGRGNLDHLIIKLKEKYNNVNWFGYVNHRYLPNIYYQNDIFISTSKWESLPYNILEAQACGLPVIAFDIPGPQDIILDKKTGFLVVNDKNFCAKIIEIVRSEITFDRNKIRNAINSNFNAKIIYEKIMSMFSSIIVSQ